MMVSRPSPKVALPTEKDLVIAIKKFPAKTQRSNEIFLVKVKLCRLCAFAGELMPSEYTLDLV